MSDLFADGELRMRGAALRAEWRDEEEAWTRAALEHWEHGRTLRDVALDCMHRGDGVAVTAAGVVLTGTVTAVGVDTMRLVQADAAGEVDVSLAANAAIVLRVDGSTRGEGSGGAAGAATFRTRLLEHEACALVEIGVATPDGSLTGALRTGADHVRVRTRDGIETYVPLGSVLWVRDGDRNGGRGRDRSVLVGR